MSSVLGRMRGSVEVVLALVLVVLIRLSGGPFSCRNHPVLGPFFKVDPLYLDSLVEHLCLPPDDVVDFASICALDENRWPLSFQSLPGCVASTLVPLVFDLHVSVAQVVQFQAPSSCAVLGRPRLVHSHPSGYGYGACGRAGAAWR